MTMTDTTGDHERDTKRCKEDDYNDTDVATANRSTSPPSAASSNSHSNQQQASSSSSSLFNCSDDDFQHWIASQLTENYPQLSQTYPDLFSKAPVCFVKWRQRFGDNRPLWKRLFDKDRVLKEFVEAVPVLDAVLTLVEKADLLNNRDAQQYTIVDLCSGKGYLSMLLAEMLPPDKVFRIVLMDKAFCMRNQQPGPQHINWEHIYGETNEKKNESNGDESSNGNNNNDSTVKSSSYYDTWPISLDTSKQDLKASRQLNNIPKHYFSKEHPAIILAIHLCGTLSLRAIDLYNNNPDTVHFLALKPCCLPGMVHAKRHEIFEIGNHKFDAEEVCIHGKWKQNKWVGGPPRSHMQQKFQVWARHLYCGIVAAAKNDNNKEEENVVAAANVAARKLHCRVNVQTEGGFQNDFLFAQRTPTTEAMWERLRPYQVEASEDKFGAVATT